MVKKPFNFSLSFVEPSEHTTAIAKKFLTSPDEDRRCVAKALLDVAAVGVPLRQAMQEGRGGDMDPYLDFWFGDSVTSAKKLLKSHDPETHDLATCLIDAEKTVIKSKESVLTEFKRLGIKPGG